MSQNCVHYNAQNGPYFSDEHSSLWDLVKKILRTVQTKTCMQCSNLCHNNRQFSLSIIWFTIYIVILFTLLCTFNCSLCQQEGRTAAELAKEAGNEHITKFIESYQFSTDRRNSIPNGSPASSPSWPILFHWCYLLMYSEVCQKIEGYMNFVCRFVFA